jgi:hypothetical protein
MDKKDEDKEDKEEKDLRKKNDSWQIYLDDWIFIFIDI